LAVPILKQGSVLIASIQTALTDTDVLQLREDVMSQVTRHRSRGIIVDVTALDVMDSFVSRSLRGIAHMTRLRGAETVIVGIQPEVAFAMVQLGMSFEDVQTALDLEIVVDYGVAIADVARSVRENVIAAVERMTGLEVVEVNIAVSDVKLPDEADEEEAEPRLQ